MIRLRLLLAIAISSPMFAAVDGVVMNATTGKPQPSVEINLLQPGAQGMQALGKTQSDAQGKFKIDVEIPPGPALLQGSFEGATYNLMLTPVSPKSGVTLEVFNATTKPESGKLTEHMILLEPTESDLQVSEAFLLQNDTRNTFLDPVKGSIQFYVPDAAIGVRVVVNAPGGMPIQRQAEKTNRPGIFKIAYPLKPGETRFDLNYTLPPTKKLSGKVLPSAGHTRLLTPATVTITGDGIENLGQEPRTQAHIYNLTGLDYNVLIEGTGSLRSQASAAPDEQAPPEESGAPEVEMTPARIYSKLGWVLGLAFGVLAAGGLLLFRRGAA